MRKSCDPLNRRLLVILLLACLAIVTQSEALASEVHPQPSPSPSPGPGVIAIIDSMVVNGVKSDTATPSDIELMRAGAAAPEATVGVGNELRAGDKISTKDEDQLVLRVPNSETGTDDVVFLDPNSEVGIGSICAFAGRVLSWAGLRFRLCTSWGTLGVEGTEFEVKITPTGELTVLVYEGKVKLDPEASGEPTTPVAPESRRAPRRRPPVTRRTVRTDANDILPGTALKVKPDGTTERAEVTAPEKVESVNYWSEQIIKVSKPVAGSTKGFVNYAGGTQAEEFKKARREALIDNQNSAYLKLGKVLNDWNDGAAAQKSLAKVKDESVIKSADYMVNVAEADRLQGRLTAAEAQLNKTTDEHPNYAAAYYLKAKVGEDKVAKDPSATAMEAAQIRKNFAQALDFHSGDSHLQTSVVEADLDKTIKYAGTASLNTHTWLAPGNEWLGTSTDNAGSRVSGTASIEVGQRSARGRAELVVVGDQFKLKVGTEIFTGSIVGNKNAAGFSFAMKFDNVAGVGGGVLSVTGTRTGKGFTLTAARQPAGTFTFTTDRSVPR